ncbi:MAG: oligosaccharide flippase family protein [Verrucomicrobiae bacterium]|nr:oligosaccharide flippase family protein [Verrucomicrobiae bacterium]
MKTVTSSLTRANLSLRLTPETLLRIFRTLLPSGVRMLGAGVQFLSTVIVARTLGDEESSLFFFWSAILMTSGPIATYGLEQIALRNVPRLHESGPVEVGKLVGNLRFVSLLVSFVLGLIWVGYAVISEPPPGGFRIWHLLPPIALAAIAATLINGEALKGLSRPVMGIIYGHLLPVSIFCLSVFLFAGRFSSPGILTLYTGSYAIGALAARFAPVADFRYHFLTIPDRETLRSLFREGFPVTCVSLFGALGFIAPLTLLEYTRPAAEVSYITTAFRISILFLVLASAIHSVFAPSLSKCAELPRPFGPVFRVYLKAIFFALATLCIPLFVGILFPEMVMSVFGESFRNGASALRLLLIVQLISLSLGPMPHLLLMTGHTGFLAKLSIGKFVITTLLALILIPRTGGLGMIVAMGIAFIVEELIGLTYAIVKLRKHEILTPPAS